MERLFNRMLFLTAVALGCMVPISLLIDPTGRISRNFLMAAACFALACGGKPSD